MSAVGFGADVGLLPVSVWNNPEPEIVLAVSSDGRPVGATLGNDVNLRDIEGRSALLLGKCKDNNGSCAIGPFVRLFDDGFTLDSVREPACRCASKARTTASSSTASATCARSAATRSTSSRRPAARITSIRTASCCSSARCFRRSGTATRPAADSRIMGDRVTLSTPALGALVNTVRLCTEIAPWTFGVRALYANLAARGLLAP